MEQEHNNHEYNAKERQKERARYLLERLLTKNPAPILNKDGSESKKGTTSKLPPLTDKAREELIEYADYLKGQLGILTRQNYIDRLARFNKITGKAMSELTAQDYADYWKTISNPEKYIIKSSIKRYYLRFKNKKELFEEIDRLAPTPTLKYRKKNPNDLILVENGRLQKLIRGANNKRDKALIGALFDSGARITELLSVRVCDLDFRGKQKNKHNPLLLRITESKTVGGENRTAYIYNSYLLLMDYLENHHPYRAEKDFYNSEYPLFVDRMGKAMKRQTVQDMLRTTANRVGIRVRVYNHLFRASAIYHLKYNMGFSIEEIAHIVGHSNINTTQKHYLAMDDKKIEERFATGGAESEESAKRRREATLEKTANQYCFTCDKEVAFTSKICGNCGTPLNIVDTLTKQREEKAVALNEHRETLKKYMREMFAEIIEEEAKARVVVTSQ